MSLKRNTAVITACWLLVVTVLSVSCKALHNGSESEFKVAYDEDFATVFLQEGETYYFAVCLYKKGDAGAVAIDHPSCVNGFTLEDGTPAVFELSAINSLKPTQRWRTSDLEILSRLQNARPERLREYYEHLHGLRAQTAKNLVEAGFITFLSGKSLKFLFPRIKLSSLFRAAEVFGVITMVGGGIHFLTSSNVPKYLPSDITEGEAVSEIANQYVGMPVVVDVWPSLFSEDSWQPLASLSGLNIAIAKYLNRNLYPSEGTAIAEVCVPIPGIDIDQSADRIYLDDDTHSRVGLDYKSIAPKHCESL